MTDGLITLLCDYCGSLVGYLDTKPTQENLVIKGAQVCCELCHAKGEGTA